jgi:hypothetical protein
MTIWSQFEGAIKSSAYTDRLADFIERFTRKLQLDIRAEDLRGVTEVLTCGADREVLRMLRSETALLAVLVRLKNEERKNTRKETAVNANADTEHESDGSLFDHP